MAFGGIGSVQGSLDFVHNYDSGQSTLFATGGAGLGWNGGLSASGFSGIIYGNLRADNSGYSAGFTGGYVSGLIGVYATSSSGGLTNGAKGMLPNGAVTVVGMTAGASLVPPNAGFTDTHSLPIASAGRFAGFSALDALLYAARRPCQ